MQSLNRRTILRLGAMGTAMALGQPLIVAQADAQQKEFPPDKETPLWTAEFGIEGCPVSSANVQSIDVDPLEFDLASRGKAACAGPAVRAVIRFGDEVTVRKELSAWLHDAHERRLRNVTIVLTHRGGGKRGYSLAEAFPVRFSHVDLASGGGGATLAYVLEVRVSRIEMA